MSKQADQKDSHDVPPESGLEALRRSSEFRGPVEPVDGHVHVEEGANDHLASIYDGQDDQFAAAIPFVEQGLDRGERCLYIADDNSREEVLEAMRDRGIDADAALESGALSIHTKEDTYLRTGEFDRDAMVAFWEDTLERARNEDGYAGIRAAAEMTWALDGGADLGLLVEYESILNDVFAGEDYVVLCQYNRDRFPPEIVRDVIRTHPHLISDGTVYHNAYYTPPEEYFGPDQPGREIDRMMGTLREWTEAKTELREHQRYLREQTDITASPDLTFEEKLQALFDLGCERFGLDLGAMARVDPETDGFVIEYTSDDHDHIEPGTELPLSETYCSAVTATRRPVVVSNPVEGGYENTVVHREFGLKTYLGTYVESNDGFDRTFFFVSSEPRDEPFSEEELAFHQLMGQWVQYELERENREARLESKNDRLESFASMLAHELRNPVTIGQIYSQQLPGETESEAVDYVTEAFDRIEDMIDVMLVLTRGCEVVGERTPVSLADAARAAWDDVDAAEATLDVGIDRTIRADETYVRHLFQNLFENAVEHGGADVAVTVGALPTGFYVADDGPGIPAEDRNAVFEAGYTTASEGGGTGLGLAFVRELTRVYGWECAVTESDAGGARFEFRNVSRDER